MMMTLPLVLEEMCLAHQLFDYIGSLLFDARLHALNTATGIALLTLLEKDRRRVVHVATLCHKRSVGDRRRHTHNLHHLFHLQSHLFCW